MTIIDPGHARITPDTPVVAGSWCTIDLTYTAEHPVDDNGYIMICFRHMGDFGTPQFTESAAPNFCSLHTNGDCVIEPRWDPKGHTRPWSKALYLKITRGYLDHGQFITIRFGDTTGGSPGWRMQTFRESTFELKTLADPVATYQFKELKRSPTLRIIPDKPVKAVCLAPSSIILNQPFYYYLKREDKWGNPTGQPKRLQHHGFNREGIEFIEVEDEETGLTTRSNPLRVAKENPPRRYCWADFHGQSEETIGTNSIEDYFHFARDYACLDIIAHQGNDFQITDDFWQKINQVCEDYYDPDHFVTLPGYEWSGNTPLGGDRNVYFSRADGLIARSSRDLLPGRTSRYEDAGDAGRLFRTLKKQQKEDRTVFTFAHVGGRYADMSMHDPDLEIAIEIHSAWGTFPWLLADALRRGYRVGICANSDGHKGRPGASYPGIQRFGSYGGLTCVLAEELTREAVVKAMRQRRFYATTGNRAIIDLQLQLDNRLIAMGDIAEAKASNSKLQATVIGTGPVEKVSVFNGSTELYSNYNYTTATGSRRIKITWSGAEVRGRGRACRWDGALRVNDNRIKAATPVNFWNPEQLPELIDEHNLAWQSTTTGGLCGLILNLEKESEGTIEITTAQGNCRFQVNELSRTPKIRQFGGLEKQITAYSLAASPPAKEMTLEYTLDDLHKGDNPIYIKMIQEDGHMAWSSPIYLINR